jgi:hypothetical protein
VGGKGGLGLISTDSKEIFVGAKSFLYTNSTGRISQTLQYSFLTVSQESRKFRINFSIFFEILS